MIELTPAALEVLARGYLAKEIVKQMSVFIGGALKPYQMKRLAEAQREIDSRASSPPSLTPEAIVQADPEWVKALPDRASTRIIGEAVREQENLEAIIREAVLYAARQESEGRGSGQEEARAKPSDDWISQYLSMAKHFSEDYTRTLWARVLAGEFDAPGSFPIRILDVLRSMSAEEAKLFRNVVGFSFQIPEGGVRFLLATNFWLPDSGLHYGVIAHMRDIGLLAPLDGPKVGEGVELAFFSRRVRIKAPGSGLEAPFLDVAAFTFGGTRLAALCDVEEPPGYFDAFVKHMRTTRPRWKIEVVE